MFLAAAPNKALHEKKKENNEDNFFYVSTKAPLIFPRFPQISKNRLNTSLHYRVLFEMNIPKETTKCSKKSL